MIRLKKNHIYKIYLSKSSRYDANYIFLCPSSDKFINNRCLGKDDLSMMLTIDYIFCISLRGLARWHFRGLFVPNFIKIERVYSASDIAEIKKALKEHDDWPYKYIVDKSRIEII